MFFKLLYIIERNDNKGMKYRILIIESYYGGNLSCGTSCSLMLQDNNNDDEKNDFFANNKMVEIKRGRKQIKRYGHFLTNGPSNAALWFEKKI